ncbi:hypothetical protein [Microcoleus sp. BROC3]|uniref:hypothetical protein n=1 Tax=Microcoleus sp. BROC3 TaxID=3055323 RepID=UPI002FD42C3E
MKLEEYQKRLIEAGVLPWNEYNQKRAELQAEYLAGQVVADAETAIKFISDAQQRGELPELDTPVNLEADWRNCELLELNDEESPDKRWWRCQIGSAVVVDVSAENGEVVLMSV